MIMQKVNSNCIIIHKMMQVKRWLTNKFEYAMDWSFQNLFLALIEHDIAI